MAESTEVPTRRRLPRRPRRARFASRQVQGGTTLADIQHNEPHTTDQVDETEESEQRVDELELTETGSAVAKFFGEKLTPTIEYFQRTTSLILTSPGKLTFTAIFLIIAILAAGLSMSATTATRQQQLANMTQAAEPLSHASQNLYASLTIADASANTAFSRGNLEDSTDLRKRYDDAIAQASLAATRAAAGVDNVQGADMKHIATVQRLLPVYTGLVESARANSRQAHPVGVSYLASASGLMTSEILPAASALYEETSQSTNRDRGVLTAPPIVPLSGILAAIVFLIAVQWIITRRTGRLINAGLLVATILMVIAFAGVAISTVTTWDNQRLYGNKTAPVAPLVEARILSQKTRSTETLELVRRQQTDGEQFMKNTATVQQLLSAAQKNAPNDNVSSALDALGRWEQGHATTMLMLNNGDYAGAIRVATDETSSGKDFRELDSSLQAAISEARVTLRNDIEDARKVSAALSSLTVALTVIASICVVIGFRNRLLEYL